MSAGPPAVCPTATHESAAAHDTLTSAAPGGAGAGCTCQCAPFQRRTSSLPRLLPTAVHASGAVQDTLTSPAPRRSENGEGTSLQTPPSHCSIRVPCGPEPTATHIETVEQDTPASVAGNPPGGCGVD